MNNLEQSAYELLIKNLRKGYNRKIKKYYFYISPDNNHYHQWFWDSCFHIIVMCEFKPDYAIKELETLLSVQKENGFIPHIIFWKFRLRDYLKPWWRKELHPESKLYTAEIQPPVIALSLEKIYKKTKDIEILKRFLNRVEKFYIYLEKERDPDKDLLVSIITPMESGMDLCPQYDIVFNNFDFNPKKTVREIGKLLFLYKKLKWDLKEIFKRKFFDVEDVAFNTIYAMGIKTLSFLFGEMGDNEKSEYYRNKYKKIIKVIIEKFWDEKDKIFYSLGHKGNREFKLKVKTVSSLFPLCLDIPEIYVNYLVGHIKNPDEFWLNYPVPSVSKDERSFGPLTDTRYLWRGTTWINANWFLYKGLLKHKKLEIAEEIKKRSIELIDKFGFCEFYDPLIGYPGKAMRNFGWSTLIVDF